MQNNLFENSIKVAVRALNLNVDKTQNLFDIINLVLCINSVVRLDFEAFLKLEDYDFVKEYVKMSLYFDRERNDFKLKYVPGISYRRLSQN